MLLLNKNFIQSPAQLGLLCPFYQSFNQIIHHKAGKWLLIFSITNINGSSSSLGVRANKVLSLLYATASYRNAVAVEHEPVVAALL